MLPNAWESIDSCTSIEDLLTPQDWRESRPERGQSRDLLEALKAELRTTEERVKAYTGLGETPAPGEKPHLGPAYQVIQDIRKLSDPSQILLSA